jgi:hypothetical protein
MHSVANTRSTFPSEWDYATRRMNEALQRYLRTPNANAQANALKWAMAWRAAAGLYPHFPDRPGRESR